MYSFCFAACVSHFDIAFKNVACMPYLFFLYMKYHFSPLDGLWVHCKVTPPPEFHQGSLIFCQYPFILLGRERHGESEMFYPRIQQNDLAKTQTYTLHLEYTNFSLTCEKLVHVCGQHVFHTNCSFYPKLSARTSVRYLVQVWVWCLFPPVFFPLHNSFNTVSDNVHGKLRDSDW